MPVPDAAPLRAMVERHFRVYEAAEDKLRGGPVVARRFHIMFPPGEFESRFAAFRAELARLDPALVAFLRRDGGEDVLYVAERPPDRRSSTPLRIALLAATLVTTTMAGAIAWEGYRHGDAAFTVGTFTDPRALGWGFLTFALPLMVILGLHEGAHSLAARRHRLKHTFPLFIPAPPGLMPIGTFGAFITVKDPLPNRKALFDVGASGPLAGFLVAIPILLVGMFLTNSAVYGAQPVPDIGRPTLAADLPFNVTAPGTGHAILTLRNPDTGPAVLSLAAPAAQGGFSSWTYTLDATVHLTNGTTRHQSVDVALTAGQHALRTLNVTAGAANATVDVTWDDGLVDFGEPLLMQALDWVWPAGGNYLMHPTEIAAWAGLFVTGLNLLPIGQLDGGHVARGLLGDGQRRVAQGIMFGLVALSFVSFSWIVVVLFLLLMGGIYHPPPLDDLSPLGRRRRIMGIVMLVVFVLTFVPFPLHY